MTADSPPSSLAFADSADVRKYLDADESLNEVPEKAGLAEESAEELRAAKKGFFPALFSAYSTTERWSSQSYC